MRRYKNLLTGVIVEVESEVTGKDWQEIVPAGTADKKPDKQKEASNPKKEKAVK